MLLQKALRVSAAGLLAVSLAACNADGIEPGTAGTAGTNGTNGTNGGTTPTPSQMVTEARQVCNNLTLTGTLGGTQRTLCTALANTPLDPANVLVAQLLLNSPLEDLVTQLDALLGQGGGLEAVDALLQRLALANDAALAPVVQGLNSVLVALLADQDPTAIIDLLTDLGNQLSGGNNLLGGQLLGLLGSGDNPITSLLGALTGNAGGSNPLTGLLAGLSGNLNSGNNPEGAAGLVTVLQDNVLTDLLADTQLSVLNDLLGELVDPQTGVLAPLTGALDQLTGNGSPLMPVTDLVTELNNGLLVPVGEGLAPVLDAVGGLLGGLLNGLGGLAPRQG